MKLYAVSRGEYSGYRVLAIFELPETAGTYAQALETEYGAWWVEHLQLELEKAVAIANGSLVGGSARAQEVIREEIEKWRSKSPPYPFNNDEYRVEEFDYYPGQELPAPGLVTLG